ncbi:TPA: Baseplate J family protein [Burkholderia multivorans]|nr:Baseplate J family protein [Burkholderia multivorans]HDR9351503.1 Baseplate J family protein [Burkholderia multivorans]HDR9367943.1 Baseplate J family protein [Burkholderia multivorans]HDR9374385.1 Baseplate J family protein [Burkholderia multivorans]
MRPLCGRPPSLIFSGRVAALYSVFGCVRRCAQQSARVTTRPPCCPLPPVPPASRNGRTTARAEKAGGRTGGFCRCEHTRNAENSGILRMTARKSLILEASAAPIRGDFAPNHTGFALSPIFASVAAAPFSSLSKLLKKKKKECEERQGIDSNAMPRVMPVLPSIVDGAYFLSPESGRPALHV